MKKQENYKIVFNDNNENSSKVIFAISKLVNYLEQLYQNEEDITITFSSINYINDEDNHPIHKNGEITLQVTMSLNISSEYFKSKLNSIIRKIKNFYKINEILVKEIN